MGYGQGAQQDGVAEPDGQDGRLGPLHASDALSRSGAEEARNGDHEDEASDLVCWTADERFVYDGETRGRG